MILNRVQRIVIVMGVVLLVATGLYPPWMLIFDTTGDRQTELGYASLLRTRSLGQYQWQGLTYLSIDLDRLITYWGLISVVTIGLAVALKSD